MKQNYTVLDNTSTSGSQTPVDRYDQPERWQNMLEVNDSYYKFVSASAPGTSVEECRAVWVSGAGNLAITGSDGSNCVLESVSAGTLIKVRFNELGSATTATKITLLY